MRMIHKHKLPLKEDLLGDCEILKVAEQRQALYVWVIFHTERIVPADAETSKIKIYGTGQTIPDESKAKHIETVVMSNGYVWHVFEELGGE